MRCQQKVLARNGECYAEIFMDEKQLKIRPAMLDDVQQITSLSSELGYLPDDNETRESLESVLRSSDSTVYVAVVSGYGVVGWIHVYHTVRIESGCFGEIGGLIVTEQYRNLGIGKKLLLSVEKWLKKNGIKKLRVRSNIERNNSHRFYAKLGFKKEKTQIVLDKILS